MRFTKDSGLYRISQNHSNKGAHKNASAMIAGNYSKINESLTFDYSVDFKSSKEKLQHLNSEMITGSDPAGIKSSRKSLNSYSKRYTLAHNNSKKQVLTPKSQSPSNDGAKSKKINKYAKCLKSKHSL